ncbi:hypothetical protein KAW96_08605 [candidate division WOR-3 bacterium]|nr:hypothetical protein [candidate division WOR-3 bacterium]
MNENTPQKHIPALLGIVEPHAHLLKVPTYEQLLYKIVSVENLLRSIIGNYLHFNRVDSYADFTGADLYDGRQLPKDQQGNVRSRFERAPDFSAADYYDQSRARTYACCFSLENSDFIWNNYAKGRAKGKICIVFGFGRLRATINRTLQPGNAALEYNGSRCKQMFSVNYGIVEYVEWKNHQENTEYLPNPIKYTYLKDKKYANEKELRISLSTLGMGHFTLEDGSTMQFPASLQLFFDFRSAIADQTIQKILCTPDYDSDFLQAELHKLRIVPSKG